MYKFWTFSPSSEREVERCIAAAQPPDDTNKWILRFGRKNHSKLNITSTEVNQDKSLISNIPAVEDSGCVEKEDLYIEHFEELSELIQSEPVARFNLLVAESMTDHRLLNHLANRLSISASEKIINHIYDNKELDSKFIEKLHQYFMPCLLHKEHSWFTLDMLIKSYRIYPKAFEILVKIILKDIQISNKVFQDLIENLNEKELSEVMIIAMDLELSTEEFLHNIFGIYSAYKSLKKNMELQNWIFKQILQHSNGCVNDKNYGKLLLAFLQAEKETQSLNNYGSIEKVLDMHRSPFKRPCMNVLQELLEKHNSMDITGVYSEVII